ncbi:hypothetical protein Godav_028260, partial [Gossypium davidsonii]|nr:hypothetical protein [Gossypium davidsonii]
GLQNDIDLLNPPAELEKKKHKLKRLVQTPNSFFMVIFKKAISLYIYRYMYVLGLTFVLWALAFVW